MDNNRLLIAILAVIGVLFLYQELLQWRYPDQYGPNGKQARLQKKARPGQAAGVSSGNAETAGGATSSSGAGANENVGSAAGIPNGPRSAPGEMTAGGAPAHTVTIATNLYTAVLTSHGGRLIHFRLKDYHETVGANSPDYEMVRPSERPPMGLLVANAATTVDDGEVEYATTAPSEIQVTPGEPGTVTFEGTSKDGAKLVKTFTFRDSTYVFNLNAQVTPAAGAAASGVGLMMSQPLTELAGYRDYPTLQAYVKDKALSEGEKPLEKGVAPVSGPITYAGFGDRYFLAVFIPQHPTSGTLTMDYAGAAADARMLFEGTNSVASQVYMGPKELDILEAVNPSLSKAIDLGFWGVIALPFLRALKIFYRVAPNYGVAIILLTVVVRLLTLPMGIKGQRSMMKMQRLQPQVERIREKFKDDQERLNKEMVELYKRNHVNPLGGCLPMAIQFPVFIGLYEALLNAIELRHAPFIGWIKDLSAPDCLTIPGMPAIPFTDLHGIPVLVILMTITAFAQQWMSPRQPDPNQQKMMMYMPVVFSLIFLELPAGLSLYYFSSNLLGVVQQFVLNREFKQYTPVATT